VDFLTAEDQRGLPVKVRHVAGRVVSDVNRSVVHLRKLWIDVIPSRAGRASNCSPIKRDISAGEQCGNRDIASERIHGVRAHATQHVERLSLSQILLCQSIPNHVRPELRPAMHTEDRAGAGMMRTLKSWP